MDEAVVSLTEAVQLDPADWRMKLNRGSILLLLGRHAEALADAEAVLQAQSRFGIARVLKASALRRLGRAPEALSELNEALEQQPDDGSIRLNRDNVLLQMNRLDEAMSDYTAATKAGIPMAYMGRGMVHQRAGRIAEAMGDYDQAIRLDGKCREAWLARGHLTMLGAERASEAATKRLLLRKALDDFEHAKGHPSADEAAAKARRLLDTPGE